MFVITGGKFPWESQGGAAVKQTSKSPYMFLKN
jgi:hypothetical protein